jgi:hypothetical protein
LLSDHFVGADCIYFSSGGEEDLLNLYAEHKKTAMIYFLKKI